MSQHFPPNSVFNHPRTDGLDILATTATEIDDHYIEFLSACTYIGWLSSRDLDFLAPMVDRLMADGIVFHYYAQRLMLLDEVWRIVSYLDWFVAEKNKVSRTDQEGNYSVMRLREILRYATEHRTNLFLFAD